MKPPGISSSGGNISSSSENVTRIDKLHHMIYIGNPPFRAQITVDDLGEVYGPGLVMSPGAAADGGPEFTTSPRVIAATAQRHIFPSLTITAYRPAPARDTPIRAPLEQSRSR